ncbi:MAG: extracellular solute-binding protein, partial [Clostridiales bacterium]|nr:extracellular solute-binding protein [Clostridiales bacterium]
AEAVKAENDAGSVAAVTLGDTMYAYPMTSDNGYFLYYDKSVVTDPSTLEGILADCEAAGKNFYFEINSGWYQTAFFFGAGAELTFDTDNEGKLVKMNSTYASDAGVKALKAMIALHKSPAFQNGSSISAGNNIGAIVDGTWDATSAKEAFGDNYAATKLPTVDGFQLGGFGGFKMLGVKPQTDEAKLGACDALAAFLTGEEVQVARYNAVGWGPSNLNAQKNEAVQADVALSALASQLAFTMPQGQYPGNYWSLATGLGDDIIAGNYDDSDDAALLEILKGFEATCETYLDK